MKETCEIFDLSLKPVAYYEKELPDNTDVILYFPISDASFYLDDQ